jgi:serine/threonine protein kinase
MTSPGEIVGGCMVNINIIFLLKLNEMNLFQILISVFLFYLDTVKDLLDSGGGGIICSGIENSTGELFVLKFIPIGGNDTEAKKKTVKELNSEFHVGMNISRNSENLVHYKKIFEYKSFSVIVMEYCDYGDLQTILDNGKKFI